MRGRRSALLLPVEAKSVTFDDGMVHLIDANNSFPFESVIVRDGPGSTTTTVNLVSGGEIGHRDPHARPAPGPNPPDLVRYRLRRMTAPRPPHQLLVEAADSIRARAARAFLLPESMESALFTAANAC